MDPRTGAGARPAVRATLLLALIMLASLLLPVGTAAPARAAELATAPARAESPVRPPSDVDPAVLAEAERAAAGKAKRTEKKPPTAQAAKAADRAARLKAGAATAAARAAAEGPPAAPDCPALPLAPFGDPGSAVGKVTLPGYENGCFTFTAERAGLHLAQAVSPDGSGQASVQVFDGENRVDCSYMGCELPRTGAFTLQIVNNHWDPNEYHTSVVPLVAGTPGCDQPLGTSLAAPPVAGVSSSPLAVICRPFTGQPGERFLHGLNLVTYGDATARITDDSGADICPRDPDGHQGCVLPGTGPYRLIGRIIRSGSGFPAEYTVGVQRLSQPEGCQTVPLNQYGAAPTASDPGTGCKTFTAPATARYDAYAVGTSHRSPQRIHDSAGRTVCESWTQPCELTAGTTYTLHTTEATLVLDRTSTANCRTAGRGTHRGTLLAGATDCLALPFPAGAAIALPQPYRADQVRVENLVVDATGREVCDGMAQREGTCKLTGTAPFRVLVGKSDDSDLAAGPYTLAVFRTDDPAGCRTLPAGNFTAQSPSAAVTTGGGAFADCLAIPATQHSTSETLQLNTVTGTTRNTGIQVIGADGRSTCSIRTYLGGTWTGCDLAAGAAYTVLFTGTDTPASYTLTRRDVTSGAQGCTKTPAGRSGGPSTGGKPVNGGMTCHQITTSGATDALYLNVRDANAALHHTVFRADGSVVECEWARACGATGSTHYQLVVSGLANKQPPASYRVDAARFRTGSAPAPECTKAGSVTYGYGPVSGALDEQRAVHCTALPTAANDAFDVKLGATDGAAPIAVPALYNHELKSDCGRWSIAERCTTGYGPSGEPRPATLVLGLPEAGGTAPYRLRMDCMSATCGTERHAVTGLTTASGAAGAPVTVQLKGTALHDGDRIRLERGDQRIDGTAVTVSSDRRLLTARLDLKAAATGPWNVWVRHHTGQESHIGTYTVTTAPVRNTRAPAIAGTGKVGTKAAAQAGAWTPAPTAYSYQWLANGVNISGATGTTYTVPASLLGKKLSLRVTALRTGHPSGAAVTASLTVAKGAAPKAVRLPVISGTAKVGKRLTAKPGTWTPTPAAYAYQWYAKGKAIPGAVKPTLDLKKAQAGQRITVKVTARRAGHPDGAAISAATAAVRR